MADRDPALPGPRPGRETPLPGPAAASEDSGRTIGEARDDPGDGYEILAPVATPTVSYENATTAPDPTEVPEALVDHPRYRVVRWLGSGGMGSVYLAEHRLMERPVALKLINRDLTDHAGVVERFGREVRAAARLHHPQIVTAFDAEQAGPVHFLVMEFVEGTDLARLVKRRGPLPVAVACDCIRQAALGLQHAHEHGMVHRDIKPQNLMRTRRGHVKILDFGLALFASEVGSGDGVTRVGAMLGTADYVAPEQADDAHSADIRADIYSLGCTLYYLLAGHAPFPGGTLMQKLTAHSRRKPKEMSEIRNDLPAGLETVLDRMMAKDPDDRYPSPAEVAEALAPFAGPSSSVEKEGPSGTVSSLLPGTLDNPGAARGLRRFRVPLLAALAVLILGGGLLTLAWSRNRKVRPEPIEVAVSPRVETPVPPPVVTPEPSPPVESLPPPPAVPTPVAPAVPPPVVSSTTPPAVPDRTAPAPGPAPARPRAPDEVLRGKSLRLVGVFYRLESEALVESESLALQTLQFELGSAWARLLQYDPQILDRTQRRRNLNTTPRLRNSDPSMSKAERDRIDFDNAQESLRADAAQRQASELDREILQLAREQQQVAAKFEVDFADFQRRQLNLQQLYTLLMNRYTELNRDPEVKAALDELNLKAQPKVVLGPAKTYGQYRRIVGLSAMKTLQLKGLEPGKPGRLILVAERMAKVQGAALRRALAEVEKADAAPRKAAADEPGLQAQQKRLIADLDKATLPTARAQLKAQLELLNKRIETGQKVAAPASPDASGPDPRADVLRAVVDLRRTAEAIKTQRDAAPEKDPEVRDAIAELNKNKRDVDRLRIAPDADAELELKKLEGLQKVIHFQEVAARIDAGEALVDASVSKSAAFVVVIDPKVAGLRLPSAMAASLGVEPTADPSTVPVKLPDGRTVPARRATVGSLRLGPVDLADVPCLILPPEAGNARPTLGTRSFGAFVAHLDPEGTKLYLARVEATPPDRP